MRARAREFVDSTFVSWLGDNAALAILSFDVDAESPILVEGRRHADNPMVMSHQAYGPRIAVPRLLDLLSECSVPATFFVPGYTADHYPDAIERIVAAGHEIGHHGYSHHSPLHLDEERSAPTSSEGSRRSCGLG